jgi:hypothetical protein
MPRRFLIDRLREHETGNATETESNEQPVRTDGGRPSPAADDSADVGAVTRRNVVDSHDQPMVGDVTRTNVGRGTARPN